MFHFLLIIGFAGTTQADFLKYIKQTDFKGLHISDFSYRWIMLAKTIFILWI